MNVEPGPGMIAGGHGSARASDADRERAIDVLKAAFAEGRLTAELSADLPAGPLGTLSPHPPGAAAAYLPAAPRPTNSLAVAALVCGLIPILPATLAALILGMKAHRQIRRTGERGTALATAGLALGVFWVLLTALVVLVLK